MAEASQKHGCPNCAQLEAKVAQLDQKLQAVENELAKARKNSGNSSKPPSSDIVNPPPKANRRRGDKKRKRGGQPGHPRHERARFEPSQVDTTWIHYYKGCPCCGGELVDSEIPDKVLQQVEIPEIPIRVTEHRRPTQRCK
jgi:transposase